MAASVASAPIGSIQRCKRWRTAGILTSEATGGKRVYTMTEEGAQLLAERKQQTTFGSPWDAFNIVMAGKPQEFMALRKAATDLAVAVMQVARGGNPERMSRVRDRLEQVKREIYAILAEESEGETGFRSQEPAVGMIILCWVLALEGLIPTYDLYK